jgi:hypothetical protein
MATALNSQPNFGVIQLLPTSSDQADTPLMTIEVKRQKVFWTPIYATSELEIKVSYASNGNVSFRHSDPPQFKFTDGTSGVMISGTYTFADVSKGIVSWPGYHNYIAAQIAKTISESVQKQLQN